jgi:glutathione S-transferase
MEIRMLLCYSALSPFCRKIRMIMDWKNIAYEVFDSCDIEKYPASNSRAEIPVLVDGDLTIANSADIVGYLDRKFPELEVYPRDARTHALVRQWEREADTLIDAVVTDVAIFKWADLPPPPQELIPAARTELAIIYDRLESQLVGKDFVAGELSVADWSLFPQLGSAQLLRIGTDIERHPNVIAWLERMAATPEARADQALKMLWWANRETADVDTKRINWGTHRLEWFLANGFLDRFVEEVRGNRVLWSVGPNNNAYNSPLAPNRNPT